MGAYLELRKETVRGRYSEFADTGRLDVTDAVVTCSLVIRRRGSISEEGAPENIGEFLQLASVGVENDFFEGVEKKQTRRVIFG